MDPTPDDLRFRFATARPSLALTATVGERWGRAFERLRTPDDLGRWCLEADLINRPSCFTEADLHAVRDLREVMHRCATAVIAGRSIEGDDIRALNAAAVHPPVSLSLNPPPKQTRTGSTQSPSGTLDHSLQRSGGSSPGLAVLSSLARDAIDLLGSPQAQQLRQCSSPTCSLLFIDTSRPGRRRWCSSQTCGGAARAHAYRQRRSDDDRAPKPTASTVIDTDRST